MTEQEVINKANGIVQGMSGSPIIQNNKIVGCVTHVSGNNPIIGYWLYIDWMLVMDKKVLKLSTFLFQFGEIFSIIIQLRGKHDEFINDKKCI